MKTAFKILAFTIMLNIAVGIMMTALPGVFTIGNTGGMKYNSTYTDPFNTGLGDTVTPSGNLQDTSDQYDRVLDVINLGFLWNFLNTIKQYLYGFIEMLYFVFGSYLSPELRGQLFGPPVGLLHVLMTFAYIIAAIGLFTGRDFDK